MSLLMVRRSGRIARDIAIVLQGSDMEKRAFSELTKTVVLSQHGAGVVSRNKLGPETRVILRRPDLNKETEARVVGLVGFEAGTYTYGLAFLDPGINFWETDFPPGNKSRKEDLFECSKCKCRERIDLNELEFDVYAVHQVLARFCKCCGSPTVWKLASDDPNDSTTSPTTDRTPEPSPMSTSVPLPLASPAVARPKDRPKRIPAKANFTACIRCPGSDDDIVVSEEISRDGLRFKSRKAYSERSIVEVAVPYTSNALNIFVRARIEHVHELSENLFLCDVSFMK